jgi:hypothetical protein
LFVEPHINNMSRHNCLCTIHFLVHTLSAKNKFMKSEFASTILVAFFLTTSSIPMFDVLLY